jgi:hypothetical protein
MKVKFLQSTVANLQQVKAGDVVDLSEAEARFLVGLKRAEGYVEAAEEVAPEIIEAAPIEHHEEQPAAKRGRHKKKGNE